MNSPIEALDEHAGSLGWEDAVSFWTDRALVSVSYAALAERSQRIGRALQGVAGVGDRVVLALPAGLDFVAAFYACLYSGAIAVPIASARGPAGRALVQGVVNDCQPAAIVCGGDFECPGGQRQLTIAELDTELEPLRRPAIHAEQPAVLQYTSGSTGHPRGVIVSHQNLMANSRAIGQAFRHGRDSHGVMWLPHYHDMGLVGGVVHPVVEGFRVTLLCPWKFMQKPVRWLRALSKRRGTTSGGPNFAFAECVRRVDEADIEDLDLSSWDLAFVGAEPIRLGILERFASRFGRAGFRRRAFFACYGLAEATLLVSGGPKGVFPVECEVNGGASSSKRAVDCGPAPPHHELAIVDPSSLCRQPDGVEGEIWVAGPSVARGYWNQDAESRARFSASLVGDERRYLRTGDWGCVVNGHLAITGRIKDVMIVRGVNYHPQDIEWTAATADRRLFGLPCAAFTVDGPEGEDVIVAQEVQAVAGPGDALDLAANVARTVLRGHGLLVREVVLVKAHSLPRTSSGKVRRSECRTLYLSSSLSRLAFPKVAQQRTEASLV